jgi:hypothetical protein
MTKTLKERVEDAVHSTGLMDTQREFEATVNAVMVAIEDHSTPTTIRRQVIEELAREAEECDGIPTGKSGFATVTVPGGPIAQWLRDRIPHDFTDEIAEVEAEKAKGPLRSKTLAQFKESHPELCAENAQNPDQTSYRQTEINPASDMDSGQMPSETCEKMLSHLQKMEGTGLL